MALNGKIRRIVSYMSMACLNDTVALLVGVCLAIGTATNVEPLTRKTGKPQLARRWIPPLHGLIRSDRYGCTEYRVEELPMTAAVLL